MPKWTCVELFQQKTLKGWVKHSDSLCYDSGFTRELCAMCLAMQAEAARHTSNINEVFATCLAALSCPRACWKHADIWWNKQACHTIQNADSELNECKMNTMLRYLHKLTVYLPICYLADNLIQSNFQNMFYKYNPIKWFIIPNV